MTEVDPSELVTRQVTTVPEAIIPKVTGLLSIVGSSLMARDVINKWRKKRRTNGHLAMTNRVILSMCVGDLGSSFWGHFIGTWMMPAGDWIYQCSCGTYYNYVTALAAGNQGTCSAQAFLVDFFLFGGAWSNAMLSVNYWLSVRREVPETKLREWKYQALLLGFPWAFSIAFTLANLVGTGFKGKPNIHQWQCKVWGNSALAYASLAYTGLGSLIVIFCMGSLIRGVYLAEKKMDKFRHGQEVDRRKTIQVSKQGLAYIAAFLVVYVPAGVNTAIGDRMGDAWHIFFATIFPLQGLFNAFIYFRPKYEEARKRAGEDESKLQTVLATLDLAQSVGSLSQSFSSRSSGRFRFSNNGRFSGNRFSFGNHTSGKAGSSGNTELAGSSRNTEETRSSRNTGVDSSRNTGVDSSRDTGEVGDIEAATGSK